MNSQFENDRNRLLYSFSPLRPQRPEVEVQSEDSSLLLNDDVEFYLSNDEQKDRQPGYSESISQQQKSNPSVDPMMMMIKIGKLIHELVREKEKAEIFRDLSARLREKNQKLEKQMQKMNEQLQEVHRSSKQKEQRMIRQLEQFEREKREKREKQAKIDEIEKEMEILKQKMEKQRLNLAKSVNNAQKNGDNNSDLLKIKKKNKQLLKINRLLEEELTITNRKLVQLEKTLDSKTCTMVLTNLFRLRDPTSKSLISNQENAIQKQMITRGETTGMLKKFSESNYRGRALSSKNYC